MRLSESLVYEMQVELRKLYMEVVLYKRIPKTRSPNMRYKGMRKKRDYRPENIRYSRKMPKLHFRGSTIALRLELH